jgi:hypothetical protein
LNSAGVEPKVFTGLTPSPHEDDLKTNTLQALASIPISMMRKFAAQSCCFIDAYDHSLNKRQAAWAAHKYRGHQVLLQDILEELDKQGVA